jgi:hypothetical protein
VARSHERRHLVPWAQEAERISVPPPHHGRGPGGAERAEEEHVSFVERLAAGELPSPLVDGPAAGSGHGDRVGAQAIEIVADALSVPAAYQRVPACSDGRSLPEAGLSIWACRPQSRPEERIQSRLPLREEPEREMPLLPVLRPEDQEGIRPAAEQSRRAGV